VLAGGDSSERLGAGKIKVSCLIQSPIQTKIHKAKDIVIEKTMVDFKNVMKFIFVFALLTLE
jgi:hypothetical protein